MTKAEIIARLTELGIEFSGTATKAELEELLQRAEESAAAGAPEDAADSPAPNQDTEQDDEAEEPEADDEANESDELLGNPEQFDNDDAEPSEDGEDEPEETPEEEPESDAEPEPAVEPDPDPEPETVKVLVGPNGEAGRIIVNRIAIDTRTPGVITTREYKSLRRRYDLRIVEDEEQ